MGILFIGQSDYDVKKIEPYKKIIAELKKFSNDYDNKSITLKWGGSQGFKDGIYTDDNSICTNASLKFSFHELIDDRIATICTCEFRYSKFCSSHNIFDRVNDISLRLPYIYIGCAEQLEAKCALSNHISINVEAICKKNFIQEMCCGIVSHIISMFTLDD